MELNSFPLKEMSIESQKECTVKHFLTVKTFLSFPLKPQRSKRKQINILPPPNAKSYNPKLYLQTLDFK